MYTYTLHEDTEVKLIKVIIENKRDKICFL